MALICVIWMVDYGRLTDEVTPEGEGKNLYIQQTTKIDVSTNPKRRNRHPCYLSGITNGESDGKDT